MHSIERVFSEVYNFPLDSKVVYMLLVSRRRQSVWKENTSMFRGRLMRKTRRLRTNIIRIFCNVTLRADIYYRRRRAIEVGIVTSIFSPVCTKFQNGNTFFFYVILEIVFTSMAHEFRNSRAGFIAFQITYWGAVMRKSKMKRSTNWSVQPINVRINKLYYK